ncbi:MAG: hypothetical protein IPP22_08685 [Nitrosomonas sp.]|nr:hypothetical protein [Nitrosomonas sp.]
MSQYWVVGAMFGGHDDQSETFIRRGYWFLGWEDKDQPSQAALRDQIKIGDRIAIKRMLGQGATNIEIRALGTVKEIDPEDKRVYIHWAVSGLQRQVPSKGAFKSIHGPFSADDDWTRLVFQL